jgi:hypothetical protein
MCNCALTILIFQSVYFSLSKVVYSTDNDSAVASLLRLCVCVCVCMVLRLQHAFVVVVNGLEGSRFTLEGAFAFAVGTTTRIRSLELECTRHRFQI